MPPPGSQIELGIKRNDAIDPTHRNFEGPADAIQDLFGQIPVDILGFLQDGDECPLLSAVFFQDRINFGQIEYFCHFVYSSS
jgi:hypothetical protein